MILELHKLVIGCRGVVHRAVINFFHARIDEGKGLGEGHHLMVLKVLLFDVIVKEYSVNVVSLHAIEASKDIHHSLVHKGFVESTRARRRPRRDHSRPSLTVKIEFVNVVEPLLVLVDSSEYVHGRLRGAGRVTITAFNRPFHAFEFEPHIFLQIKSVQVIESFVAIPSAKDVHQTFVDNGGVPESYIGFTYECDVVEHGSGTLLLVGKHNPVHLVTVGIGLVLNLFPLVADNGVLVDVFEDLHFVSAAVDVESVFVSDKCVVSSRFGNLTGVC
jgi:hypothetical protein